MADGPTTFLIALLPSALVEPLVSDVMRVLSQERGNVLSLGGLLTVWFARGGIGGLRVGPNWAHRIREGRSAIALVTLEVLGVVLLGSVFVGVGCPVVLDPRAGSFPHRLMPGFEPGPIEIGVGRCLVSAARLGAAPLPRTSSSPLDG